MSRQTPTARLASLDALRGFAMFWIVGADTLARSLREFSGSALAAGLSGQFDHSAFEGFTFFDLIFPLFLFMMGVSMVYSLDRVPPSEGNAAVVGRIARRAALLFLLGMFADGGLAAERGENILCGVLQRLALCYFFSGLLYRFLRPRALLGALAAILVGYWVWVDLIPIPGVGRVLTEDMNWCKFIDEMVPPYYQGDAEGWLSTLPAIASCLLGVFAGKALQGQVGGEGKVLWMAGTGALLTAAGLLWGLEFPVIKRLWTSSYVLLAGGLSFILLGLFYWLVEIRGWKVWAEPFVWVGLNPLAVYLGSDLLGFHGIAERLCAGLLQDPWGGALVSAVSLGLIFLASRFLHQRGIYLRV